ncbi:MAG: hypothetical protein HY370_02480 [Proteobacteria bacterium]|nr:hypothetical protein [Pseudomonadota bacterium]
MSVDRRGFLRLALAGAALAASKCLKDISFGGGEAHAVSSVIEEYKGADNLDALKEKIADLSKGQPLFVMYFATWCGFCTRLSGEFEKAQSIAKTPHKVLKVDVDKYEDIVSEKEMKKTRGVPEVAIYVDRQEIDRFGSVVSAQAIAKFIDETNAAIRAQKPGAVPSP